MEKNKYDTLNASPLNFAETEMWMGIIPASPDGKLPRRMAYVRQLRAIEFRDGGVEFNAVVYTHLDVYKRQIPYRLFKQLMKK